MGVFQNNLMGAAAAAASAGGADFYDYQIGNSYRSMTGVGYFSRTPSSAGNRKTYTISFWFKRTVLTPSGEFDIFCNAQESSSTNYTDSIRFDDSHKLQIAFKGTLSGNLVTTRVFRDTSAWMHIVIAVDTTQGTASNRVKLYINGEQETNFSTETYPAEDYQGGWCNDREHALGRFTGASYTRIGNFYMANFALVDGSQLAPTSFGTSKNGVWTPDDLSGLTWGTTGTWVRFESSSDLGNDSSGNNNDWTNNSVATHDQMLDTPTFNSDSNGGNFCTYNPIVAEGGAQKLMTLSEGNLHAQSETNDKYHQIIGTHGVKTGKWYIEWYIEAAGYPSWAVGWRHGSQLELYDGGTQSGNANLAYVGYFTGSNVYIKAFGSTGTADPQVAYSGWTSAGDAPTTGDVMMCAIDMDAGKVWWGFNGEWGDVGSGTGNPATGANASNTWTVANYTDHIFPFTLSWANPDAEIIMNCGQDGTFAGNITAGGNADDTGYGNFKYDVPAGFLALCTGNLPVADAINPAETDDDYPQKLFNTIIYTGDNGGSFTTGFQPDLVWVKRRDGSQSNGLFDSSRGTSKVLNSDGTGEEVSSSGLTSFDSTGYTMGTYYNQTGNTYVSWSWRANGGTTSTDSNGSVSSTVQADPSGSFSIVKFVGGISGAGTETVGHGLNKAPSFIINFCYDDLDGGDGNRWTRADGLTNWNYVLKLNDTATPVDKSGNGNMSAPTSTVFSINNTDILGAGSQKIICYCFANSDWINSGKYKGNGNTDGTFVYTGFRPALVVNKRIDGTGSWLVHDDARNTYNVTDKILLWNDGGAEFSGSNDKIDMLSNGFKLRSSNAGINGSGSDYIYLAMAHNPFKYATAR